jgi:hypothetical protein
MSDNPAQRITELKNRITAMSTAGAGQGGGAAVVDDRAKKDFALVLQQMIDEIKSLGGTYP